MRNVPTKLADLQQICFGLDDRTFESALKQVPDYLMPEIKVDHVFSWCIHSEMLPSGVIDQMKMIFHLDITTHFDP